MWVTWFNHSIKFSLPLSAIILSLLYSMNGHHFLLHFCLSWIPLLLSQYHTIIRAAFVCLCIPYLLRGPLMDLRQTWWVYVGWPPICPWGVLFRKGQRVTFAFHCIIYAPASRHMLQKALALLAQLQSLIRRLLLRCISTAYVGGPRNCYWGVLFLKGQRLDGSLGQRVTSFHFHYIIYDSRRRQAHATPLQKAHGVNGSTGQWVKRVDGSLSLSLYYLW